jgi:hypothetical protein
MIKNYEFGEKGIRSHGTIPVFAWKMTKILTPDPVVNLG